METMNWEAICEEFLANRKIENFGEDQDEFKQYAKQLTALSTEEIEWFLTALAHPEKKWFVVTLFDYIQSLPQTFFEPLVKAAIHETNVSDNQYFVRAALRFYDHRPVIEAILKYLEEGSNFEKVGTLHAIYWVSRPWESFRPISKYDPWRAGHRTIEDYEALHEKWNRFSATLVDLKERSRNKRLTEFVENDDITVRRTILTFLSLDPADYPESLRPLIPVAMEIAANLPAN